MWQRSFEVNCIKPIQITVVSGKGGTGKTTVVGSFATLLSNKVIADCDVDAANLHLLLKPEVKEQKDFFGAKIAVRDEEKCIHCGAAELRCRFDAITDEKIDPLACEGCGLCVLVCPTNALRLESIKCGELYISDTSYGPMVHAKLNPGGESSGRLVTIVRQQAENIALSEGREFIIIDGPPGIGCTATASLTDIDLALVVTEPTLSGIHDMQRVLQLIKHFGYKSAVIINKFDLNLENSENIRNLCKQYSVPIVGEIPFDDIVTNAIAAAVPLVEFSTGPASSAVIKTWENVMSLLDQTDRVAQDN
ncbi:MAG: ATP-binding protein [Armatimonadetes bacterium]|nr:ATP-binding protein [Armatimonadota bacterium]